MKFDNAKKVIDTHKKAVASGTQTKYANALDAVKSKDYRDRNTAIKTISSANRATKKAAFDAQQSSIEKDRSDFSKKNPGTFKGRPKAELEKESGRTIQKSSKRGTSDGYMRS